MPSPHPARTGDAVEPRTRAAPPNPGPSANPKAPRKGWAWWAWVLAVVWAHVALAAWWQGPLLWVQLHAADGQTRAGVRPMQVLRVQAPAAQARASDAQRFAPAQGLTVRTAVAAPKSAAAPAQSTTPVQSTAPVRTASAPVSPASDAAAATPAAPTPPATPSIVIAQNATPDATPDAATVPIYSPMPRAAQAAESDPAAPGAAEPAPSAASAEPVQAAVWPVGALPAPQLLHYALSGQAKGVPYTAQGELRWQHNATDYTLHLGVRSFLLGQRQRRSVGHVGPQGLQPKRYSDQSRSEQAAHFDRTHQQVVFSAHNRPVPLQAGAQDEVSVYVQLAAAIAADPGRYTPGTQLQVQTATVRDAQPRVLVLESAEPVQLEAGTVSTLKWVTQPQGRYETQVAFWVSQAHAWLPVRIRMTQANGNHIELLWQRSEPLPALPAP